MDYEVQKNCLIMGCFKSYCLLCEEVLASRLSISMHKESDTHINNLKSNKYLKNNKEDGIRQVKRGYYCEFCNLLLATKPKVSHHISEDTHKHNRGMFLLAEVNNGVLAFNKVFIDNKAWHGLIDDTCVICDVDITDEVDQHTHESTHILNMIHMKLEFYDDNLFRKVDRDFFNCLTCNLIQHMDSFAAHFQSGSHEKRYIVCRELYTCYINSDIANSQNTKSIKNVEGCISSTTNVDHKSETAAKELPKNQTDMSQEKKETPKMLNKLGTEPEYLREDSGRNGNKIPEETRNISESSESITAKNESDSFDPESDQAKICKPEEAITTAINFAKKNGIKYKYGNHSAYCRSCNVKISSSLKRMKDHVASPAHQKSINTDNLPEMQKSEPTINVQEICFNGSMFALLDRNICLGFMSFHVITFHNNVVRCQLCEINISNESMVSLILHTRTELHRQKLNCLRIVRVICEFYREFIRKIRPGLYHCGFCNILSEGIEELNSHLMCFSHTENKIRSFMLLQNL